MPRRDMDIAAVRLARRSQNEAGFKRQSARLESSPPSEIKSSWISGDVSVPALRGNGGRALRLGTVSVRCPRTVTCPHALVQMRCK